MGIDYGGKRVGIAISDERGKIAFPHSVIRNDKDLTAEIARIAQEKKVEMIVLGDTRTESGIANPITSEAEKFGAALQEHLKMPIKTIFEAWSSIAVSENSPKGTHDDSQAAAFILQRYLDMNS